MYAISYENFVSSCWHLPSSFYIFCLQKRIFVKNVLRKNGLWVNAEEIVVEKQALEPHLHRYEEALAHLKKVIEEKKTSNSLSELKR